MKAHSFRNLIPSDGEGRNMMEEEMLYSPHLLPVVRSPVGSGMR